MKPIACLLAKVKEGVLSEEEGRQLIKKIEDRKVYVREEADAASSVLDQMEREVRAEGKSIQLAADAAESLNGLGDNLTKENVKYRIMQASGQRFNKSVESASELPLGFLNEAEQVSGRNINNISAVEKENILRSVLGEEASSKSGPVESYSTALRSTIDYQRVLMNEAGIPAAKIPKDSIPVNIRTAKLVNVSKQTFLEDAKLLDKKFLIENTPFFDQLKGDFDEYLELVYLSSIHGTAHLKTEFAEKGYKFTPSELLSTFKANSITNRSSTYNLFNKKYGTGRLDVIEDVVESVRSNAKFVGRKTAFGNTRDYMRNFRKVIEDKGLDRPDVRVELADYEDYIDGSLDYWAFAEQETNVLGLFSFKPMKVMSTLKSLAVSMTTTGGPVGAAFTDPTYSAAALVRLGLSPNESAAKKTIKNLFDPNRLVDMDKRTTAQLGFNLRSFKDEILDLTRYMQEGTGSKIGDKVAHYVSKASLLEHLTKNNRRYLLKLVGQEIAALSEATFDDLNESTIRHFRLAGISRADWDEIRQFKWKEVDGVKIASPWQLSKAGKPKLAQKLNTFYLVGQEMGVPTEGVAKDLFIKKLIKGKGPWFVGWVQSIFTFKGFISSVWENHMRASLAAGDHRAVYAQTLGMLSILGIGQITVENAIKGETTNYKDPKLYLEGFVKGGGASIFGDAVATSWRDWQGIGRFVEQNALGVTYGTFADLGKAIHKEAQRAVKDGNSTLAYDLFQLANRYNPAATMWITKGIWEQKAAKEIRYLLSPEKAKRREKYIQRRMKKEGIDYWFK